jgi:hypothetical protein
MSTGSPLIWNFSVVQLMYSGSTPVLWSIFIGMTVLRARIPAGVLKMVRSSS